MRKQLRATERASYSPWQAREYLDNESKPRPLCNEGDLCTRLLEILSEFQKILRDTSNPSAELWNTPAGPNKYWYPRAEIDISDRLQHNLRVALAPLRGEVMREPEIRRGSASAGDPTDIPDLVVSVPSETHARTILRVVIEVKCTWHKDAISALRTQLAERYLRSYPCGIYCLLHFTCPTWDMPKDHRKTRHSAVLTMTKLEEELVALRDAVRTELPERRLEARIIDARRIPPAELSSFCEASPVRPKRAKGKPPRRTPTP